MSAPFNQQKQLIKKYFNLLVEEFITDPRHKKDISIVFKNHLGSSKNLQILGHTEQSGGGSKTKKKTTWTTINGAKVPGTERITTNTTYFPYKYVITFLNHYKDKDELRGTVVHEFTHHYLYSTIGKHDHDDHFYSTMERLENWFDKNQGLSPRVDKSHDRDQYVGDNNSNTNDKENTCPKCSYLSPYHSPSCSINRQPNQRSDDPQKEEFRRLNNLLKNSPNLAVLESNYQTVKNNDFYSGKNKEVLDTSYQTQKKHLQFWNGNQSQSPSTNKKGFGSEEYFLILLLVVGVLFIVIIGYLILSDGNKNKFRAKQKK